MIVNAISLQNVNSNNVFNKSKNLNNSFIKNTANPSFSGKNDELIKLIIELLKDASKLKNEIKTNAKKGAEFVTENADSIPGSDNISNYLKNNSGELISNGIEKTAKISEGVLDSIPDTAESILESVGPLVAHYKTAKGIIKGDARVTIKGAVAAIDNTIFLPVKTFVAGAISGMTGTAGGTIGTFVAPGPGSVIGTTVGTAGGYVATVTVWAKTRDKLVDIIIDILEAAKRDPNGGDGCVSIGYLYRVIFDTMVGGEDIPEANLKEAYKILGFTQEDFIKTPQEIKILKKIERQIKQEILRLEQVERDKIAQAAAQQTTTQTKTKTETLSSENTITTALTPVLTPVIAKKVTEVLTDEKKLAKAADFVANPGLHIANSVVDKLVELQNPLEKLFGRKDKTRYKDY